MDALKIINLGAEVGLSKKLTLDLYANYNPWTYKDQKIDVYKRQVYCCVMQL